MTTGDVGQTVTRRRERAAVVALAAVGLVVLAAAVQGALTGAGDFQWSSARMLLHGVDAYQLAIAGHYGAFAGNQHPNYLPLLFELLLPLGALPLPIGAAVWFGLNVAMYAAAAVLVGRGAGFGRWKIAGLTAALFASGPAGVSLINGQQTALVLFAAVLAARSRRATVAGAALAVMLTKYSFAPIALVQLLRHRRVATLGTAAAIEMAALLVYCVSTGADVAATAVAPLRVAHDMARGYGDVHTLVLIGTHRASGLALACAAACAALAGWWARRVLRGPSWVQALACGALIALATFPHLEYDYAFLLPVAAAGLQLGGRRRAIVLGAVGVHWFGWAARGLLNPDPYQPLGIAQTLVLLAAALAALTTAPARVVSVEREPVDQAAA